MGSIVTTEVRDRATGKPLTRYRALIRRKGFKSKSKVFYSLREARDWLRDNEAAATLTPLTTPASGKTLRQLVDDFVRVEPQRGWKYWKPSQLDWWNEQLGEMRVRDITRGDINGAISTLQTKPVVRNSPKGLVPTERRVTAGTVNRYLSTLASLFNYALAMGIIDAHPMKGGKVRKLQEAAGRTRILDSDEEQRLYEAARTSDWPMLYLFLRMCLTTGARRSEVLKLKWRQVQLDQRIAVLPKTKNGRARALPLVSDVCDALAQAAKVRPLHSDYVFFDPKSPDQPKKIDTAWRRCRIAAGLYRDRDDPLDRVVLHTTRHTAVTKMLRGGANLAQAAAVSGHQTLAMLKRYEHLAAQDAVELAEKLLGGKGDK